MSDLLERFSDHSRKVFARHRSRDFLDGAMAAAALVALSDGDASLEEGAEVGRLMRVLSLLRDHAPDQGVDKYLHFVSMLRKQPDNAGQLRDIVMRAAKDEEAAALLIVICHAISEADGIVRESEVREIEALGALLQIDPSRAVDMIVPWTDA